MKKTKVEITHETDRIYLRFIDPKVNKLAFTDYTEELWKIINSSSWHVKEKYIYSSKKSLHKTVMEYWYGKECCEQMNRSGFVIDHIDNDGFNCLYENLEFLSNSKNWHYKGNYYDRERAGNIPIAAVNIFKKRSGDKFQITVGFNIPFVDAQGNKISKAFFVYDTKDYDLVLSDAVLLVESVAKRKIVLSQLRYNRKKVEPVHTIKVSSIPPRPGSLIIVDGQWAIVQGADSPVIIKIAPDNTIW
jgi:hypothetical protein